MDFDALNGHSSFCDITRNGLSGILGVCSRIEKGGDPFQCVEMIKTLCSDMEENLVFLQEKKHLEDLRTLALRIAFQYMGTPYRWGGDDPMAGFDCSGFVIEILKSVGLLPRNGDWTAHGLGECFSGCGVPSPERGCLVFWKDGSGRFIHVDMCISRELSIGASGGRSNTKTQTDAVDQNAFIKIRPIRSRPNVGAFADPFIKLSGGKDHEAV